MRGTSTDHDDHARRLVDKIYALLAARDYEGVLDHMAPDVVWCESEGSPLGGVHRSRDRVRRHVFARMAHLFDDYHPSPHQFIAQGGRVCALVTIEGICATTQEPIHMPAIQVWTVAEGRVTRVHHCMDTYRLREALGDVPAEAPARRGRTGVSA